MRIFFSKYQGAGNDFVMIDNRDSQFRDWMNTENIAALCNRRTGIGADGLILLENDPAQDFRMVYFNADGSESTMCGNGGRCIIAFARHLGLIVNETQFEAIDGIHFGKIENVNQVHLSMHDVLSIEQSGSDYILDTGSPHFVRWSEIPIEAADVVGIGKSVRYSERFKEKGINVNLIQESENALWVRTYERGVEDETLSCGTGVTAAALVYAKEKGLTGEQTIDVVTKGGNLRVSFISDAAGYKNIWLIGPAQLVFKGEIDSDFFI